MYKKLTIASMVGVFLAFTPSIAAAATLPNGTCSGGGMTVTVKGGKIVAYQYGGKSYPVQARGAAVYKIGTAAALRVSNPKGNSFRGIFAMNGRDTPATFKCK